MSVTDDPASESSAIWLSRRAARRMPSAADDSTALLSHLGASKTMRQSQTPVLGLTRRGDPRTKLRAFDLGVDDILTVPFSPEELLARAIVITRCSSGIERAIVPTIRLGEMEVDIVHREVRAGTGRPPEQHRAVAALSALRDLKSTAPDPNVADRAGSRDVRGWITGQEDNIGA